jgi:hypothetical protein
VITIPESVTISRKKAREQELYDVTRTWLEKEERAPGIHASALLDPLKGYWDVMNPGALPNRLVTMFMVGKVLHAFILGSHAGAATDINRSDGGSLDSGLGYVYSPDLIHDGMVREVKTSRSFYEPKDLDDVGMYVEQLLTYMVPTHTLEAELWVLFLNLKDENGKTSPAFRCYSVRISEGDLARLEVELTQVTAQLTKAIELKDPTGLTLCREWKCGAGNCEHYDLCQPEGRYGTEQFDSGVKPRAKKASKAKR